jgi:hypothetical protein
MLIKHEWNDVTELCQQSLASLSVQLARPMIAVPNFSLHESMSAVEVRKTVIIFVDSFSTILVSFSACS